jgi:hypothetical protein
MAAASSLAIMAAMASESFSIGRAGRLKAKAAK